MLRMTKKSRSRTDAKRGTKTAAFWACIALALAVAAGMFWAVENRDSSSDYVSAYTPTDTSHVTKLRADAFGGPFVAPANPHVFILGDSYTQGVGTTDYARKNWARLVTDRLGWNAEIDGVGGTGWTWGGGANGTNGDDYLTRLKEAGKRGVDPDVVIIQGGQNDYRKAESPDLPAAVRASIDLARQQWPAAAVIVFGPEAPQPLFDRLSSISGVIGDTATTAGAVYISPSAGLWITEENSPKFDAGDGSQLNDAGHQYTADRFLAALATVGGPAI